MNIRERMFHKEHLMGKIVVTAGMLLYAIVLYVSPFSCPILTFTGVHCFGCGMTRAWLAVLHLDFLTAFSYHWMFWAVPILVLIIWCDGRIFKKDKWNTVLCLAILLGFILNWIRGFVV